MVKSSHYKNIFRFSFFLALSFFLLYLVYKDQDWSDLWMMLRKDVDYFWIFLAMFSGIFSHASRARRWQLVTDSMGMPIRFVNSFMAVMIGYFANLAIPRIGEISRCGMIHKYEKAAFPKLIGTLIMERVVDMCILVVLTLTVVILQFGEILYFFRMNREVGDNAVRMLTSFRFWILLGIFSVAFVFLLIFLRRNKYFSKVKNFMGELKEGIFSIFKLKHPWAFLFHSLIIWLFYFFALYLCFQAFEFTKTLTPLMGLTIFVLGSYGMLAPVQGGVGAWHFMVISALVLYLPYVADIESIAKTFAFLSHGIMTLAYVVSGVISLLLMPVYNERLKKWKR